MAVESREINPMVKTWCLQCASSVPPVYLRKIISPFIHLRVELNAGRRDWHKPLMKDPVYTCKKTSLLLLERKKQRYGYCGMNVNPFLLPCLFFSRAPCQVAPLYTKMDTAHFIPYSAVQHICMIYIFLRQLTKPAVSR